ncbi:DMT family transporter [Streptomyces sp. NPDC052225]|uniref:DMT family transporter n=1 Tax=Streptomyces sp. NPDC052225 TaxID=3154949 RepID=UPI0034281089
MSALALSVLLSLVSAVAYAGGAIVQERVAETSGSAYAPLRRPAWWGAGALNGTGALLHVVALAYGPLSLVQPLGALTIVLALPMAALLVGRRAGATAWRGAVMATVGLAGLLALTGPSVSEQSLDGAERLMVGLVTAGGVLVLMTSARAAHRHPVVRSVLLAVAAGGSFGMASVFTKSVAVEWSGGPLAQLPSLLAIAALATTGMLLSQASYRGAGLAVPLATATVVNPVAAAVVGLTLFGESFRYGTIGTVLALGCGVVAAGGLILLTTERIGTVRPSEPQPAVPIAGQSRSAARPGSAPEPMSSLTPVVPDSPAGLEAMPSRPRPPCGEWTVGNVRS